MQIRVLGHLEATVDDRPVALGTRNHRLAGPPKVVTGLSNGLQASTQFSPDSGLVAVGGAVFDVRTRRLIMAPLSDEGLGDSGQAPTRCSRRSATDRARSRCSATTR